MRCAGNSISDILEVMKPINQVNINNGLKKKHKTFLKGFHFTDDLHQLKLLSITNKLFIRYLSLTEKKGWGGFLLKFEENNLVLISTQRRVWYVNYDLNHIFYNIVLSDSDKLLSVFNNILTTETEKYNIKGGSVIDPVVDPVVDPVIKKKKQVNIYSNIAKIYIEPIIIVDTSEEEKPKSRTEYNNTVAETEGMLI